MNRWPPVFDGLTGWPLAVAVGVLIFDVVVRVVALVVIPYGRRPTAALAWLMAVFFVPVVGSVVFLLIGSPHLPRRRQAAQAQMNSMLTEVSQQADALTEHDPQPAWVGPVADLNYRLGAMPLLRGNEAEAHQRLRRYSHRLDRCGTGRQENRAHRVLHPVPRRHYPTLFRCPTRGDVARGASPRAAGPPWLVALPGYRATVRALEESGAEWRLMLPVQPLRGRYQRPDLRNHRKLVVVDGETAFLGSVNLIDASYNKRANLRRGLRWCDVTGPAPGAGGAERRGRVRHRLVQ